MAGSDDTMTGPASRRPSRRAEIITFLSLAFGVWPFVAVAVVGGFGLAIWTVQMIYGPPGPPPAPH